MNGIIEKIDQKYYPDMKDHWDDELFREKLLRYINKDTTVLDIGAGAGFVKQMNFRGIAGRICGVDLDPRVTNNEMLDEGKIADGISIPYDDETFDVVFADNVVEHLTDPHEVFREVYRILIPGGVFLFKTPNKSHYMPVIASLTPHKFHQFFNKKRGRDSEDTFPTMYRANTKNDVTKIAKEAGLKVSSIERIEGRPEYLRFSRPSYYAGILYEKLANSSDVFAALRILLVAELRKPETPLDN